MYTLAIYLYMLVVFLISPFHKKAGLMVRGHWKTFRMLRSKIRRDEKYIWFHAASLGEFEQGRPLMERIRQERPEFKILLTFFSPSGYEVRKHYTGADIICYLPFDTLSNVMIFMRLVRPHMAFFIKYEFWHNYLWACRHYKVPVYSVSSIFSPNQIFFRWYGKTYGKVLTYITHYFVQNEASKQLLASKGITQVSVVGDTRFDRVMDICKQSKELPLLEAFKQGRQVLVAGSSWSPDEDLFIPYFNEHPELKLVIAPHVISESHLKEIMGKLKRPVVRYTEATLDNVKQADCLIIDCFGLLSSIYRYGEIAYVGGGFGAGIHNVPEAAVYGVPVIVGPNNKHFREAKHLLQLGGCFEVVDAEAFTLLMDKFFSEKDFLNHSGTVARGYIAENAGATEVIFNKVDFSA